MRWKELYDLACTTLADAEDNTLLREDGYSPEEIASRLQRGFERITHEVIKRGVDNEEEER